MHTTIDVVSAFETQAHRPPRREETYRIHAANLKRSTAPGRILGSVDLFVPTFQLHMHCLWLRDLRGNERVSLPRVKVETPNGHQHNKSLMRWATAEAEERFQRAALRAIHLLIAATANNHPSPKGDT
jgi:hypothetical protein